MIVASSKRVGTSMRKGEVGTGFELKALAQSSLSLYTDRPRGELTLEDFEVTALGRLAVLKGIETAMSRGVTKPEALAEKIGRLLATHMSGGTPEEEARRDMVSHHILRLAYAGTEDKRRWFLTHELALFRYRLEKESPEQIASFMKAHGLSFSQISESERLELRDSLQAVHDATVRRVSLAEAAAGVREPVENNVNNIQYFKVRWMEATELVSSRRVLIVKGFAFVPRDKLVSIILARFKNHLAYCLACAFKALPAILRDERLRPILTNMATAYVGPQFGEAANTGDRVTPAQLDSSMSGEDFVKKYAYNIRHNYGKEGKRADYTPFSCTRIILGPAPGQGEFHGCPFRSWDDGRIKATLTREGVSTVAVDGILATVKTHDYQIACRRHFEARFPGVSSDNVGNHPNSFFMEALKATKAKSPKPEAGVKEDLSTAAPVLLTPPTTAAAAAGGAGAPEDDE